MSSIDDFIKANPDLFHDCVYNNHSEVRRRCILQYTQQLIDFVKNNGKSESQDTR